MHSSKNLSQWLSAWSRSQLLADIDDSEPHDARGRPSGEGHDAIGSSLTVGFGSSIAGMLLESLTDSIAPTLREKATRDSSGLLVSAGMVLKAVPLVQPGLILHLPRDCHRRKGRPVYALVVEVDDDQKQAEVIPFGLIPIPALPTELATDLPDGALQVLCLWNAGHLPLEVLERSWPLQADGSHLVKDVRQLRGALARKEVLPDDLAARVGGSLISSSDPRQAYVRHEEDLWVLEDEQSAQ
jgi:hypothetical protein